MFEIKYLLTFHEIISFILCIQGEDDEEIEDEPENRESGSNTNETDVNEEWTVTF